MSVRKQTVSNVIWGLVFIGISVVGGIVLGGIVGKNVGVLIGGICWTILGGVLLFQPATFTPTISDDRFTVWVTWSELPVWAWIVVAICFVGGILSMILLRAVHL